MRKFILIFRAALSGDAIRYAVRHRKFLLFLFALALTYIGNGLIYALEADKHDKLERALQKHKIEYDVKLSKYSKLTEYSSLRRLLKKHGLEEMRTSDRPKKLKK